MCHQHLDGKQLAWRGVPLVGREAPLSPCPWTNTALLGRQGQPAAETRRPMTGSRWYLLLGPSLFHCLCCLKKHRGTCSTARQGCGSVDLDVAARSVTAKVGGCPFAIASFCPVAHSLDGTLVVEGRQRFILSRQPSRENTMNTVAFQESVCYSRVSKVRLPETIADVASLEQLLPSCEHHLLDGGLAVKCERTRGNGRRVAKAAEGCGSYIPSKTVSATHEVTHQHRIGADSPKR